MLDTWRREDNQPINPTYTATKRIENHEPGLSIYRGDCAEARVHKSDDRGAEFGEIDRPLSL